MSGVLYPNVLKRSVIAVVVAVGLLATGMIFGVLEVTVLFARGFAVGMALGFMTEWFRWRAFYRSLREIGIPSCVEEQWFASWLRSRVFWVCQLILVAAVFILKLIEGPLITALGVGFCFGLFAQDIRESIAGTVYKKELIRRSMKMGCE